MATIKEDFVSFETAKLLKKKNCPDFGYSCICDSEGNKAQTQSIIMKWLREEYNIDIFPWKIGKGIYSCAILNSNTGQDLSSNKDFPSEKYEETVEAAIKYCLENLI